MPKKKGTKKLNIHINPTILSKLKEIKPNFVKTQSETLPLTAQSVKINTGINADKKYDK